jgi:two-component system response regulator YesN
MPGADAHVYAESLRGFLRRMESLLDSAASPDVRVTQIVTGECPSFDALLAELTRANELAPLRIAQGIGRQMDCAELEECRQGGREALCASLAGIAQAYRARSRLDFQALLTQSERVLDALDQADRDALEGAVSRFLIAAVGRTLPDRLGDASWRASMRGIGDSLHAEDKAPGAGELVEKVVGFVRANYMRDIGIGQIASHIGVTPNYLSSLFHREKGITFVRFLTGLRMERAREMLEAPGALVQDVARAVGYASVRHFSRLFQRQFGLYPSEVPRVEKNAPQS